MKKKVVLLLMTLFINGCNFISSSSGTSSLSSSNEISSSEISSSASSSSISSSEPSSSEELDLSTINISSSNCGSYGSYTSNFGTKYISSYDFGFYRVNDPVGDAFISLIPYSSYVDDGNHEGSFYNITPIFGIREITITYQTNITNGNSPKLSYGEDFKKENVIYIEPSDEKVTKTYSLSHSNFFKIDANDNRINIYHIEIGYTNIREQYDDNKYGNSSNDYRLNPVICNENLVPGSTTIEVPIKVEYTKTGYNVLKTKEYTYYTYDYIKNNPSKAEEASLVDPLDIAAYYNTFKEAPANYVLKKNYTAAKTLFGNKARCISTYSRTTGYATSVPWERQPSKNAPLYHELDIDVENSYSSGNRGVGRLVVWQYGFTSEGYDDSPVSTFTSDHYKSFREYLNDGTFSEPYDSEMQVFYTKFAPAITIS